MTLTTKLMEFVFWGINISEKAYKYCMLLNDSFDRAVSTFLSDRCVFFLANSYFPYDLNSYTTLNKSPALLYNMTKKTFYSNNVDKLIPLPILSLEIVDSAGKVLHDLTSFIETVRYERNIFESRPPSIAHIISVWELHSKILLNENDVSVKYIDTNCESIQSPIRSLVN